MANRKIGMDIIKQIELLHKQGVGIKAMARQLGISKNTVKSYLNVQNKHPDSKPSSEVSIRPSTCCIDGLRGLSCATKSQ